MAACSRCFRPLKSPEAIRKGIGPTCERLSKRYDGESVNRRIRVHLLSVRPDGSRRYIVFDSGEEYRVMISGPKVRGERRAGCNCWKGKEGTICDHIDQAAIVDWERK